MYNLQLKPKEHSLILSKMKKEKNIKLYKRLQCLHFKHLGLSHKIISESLRINVDTVTDWIKLYNNQGLNRLLTLQYEGRRKSKVKDLEEDISKYISEEMVSTISQLQDYLIKKHKIFVEHSWLYRYCKKNSIFLIKKQD